MSKKIWQKSSYNQNPEVNNYIINIWSDTSLFLYDIRASIAHAKMLSKVKLISMSEQKDLIKVLNEVWDKFEQWKFVLKKENEDSHTAIENYLIEKLWDVWKKIHMWRSRNDQVLVALRLYTKKHLIDVKKSIILLSKTLLKFAKKHEFVPLPGFTHMQQAMPSSVGQLVWSYIESLLDDLELVNSAFRYNDQNPLWSAAWFWTSLPLDRDYTTKELWFSKLQINAIYCQNSRWKIESFVVSSLVQVMMSLWKIASDMMLFTTKEFDFFEIDKSLTTWSSIMPQKQNLDIMEVLRANVSTIIANQLQLQTVSVGLISWYNKDLKITKKVLIESLDITLSSLKIVEILFKNLKPNKQKLKSAFDKDIFATDMVNELVKSWIPFRDAYIQVGDNLDKIKIENLDHNLRSKTHVWATGNLCLWVYENTLKSTK